MSDNFNVEEDVTIQNIVGSGDLTTEIDVQAFAKGLEEEFGYKYYESRDEAEDASDSKENGYTWISGGAQPGLYYEVTGEDGPQVTFHESGSYIVRADNKEELDETNERVIEEVKKLGVIDQDVTEFDFEVENVVALAKFRDEIRLRALHLSDELNSDAQYEPEVFPALEYSTDDDVFSCSFLVYGNGKVIVAGAKSVDEAIESTERFYDKVESALDMKREY